MEIPREIGGTVTGSSIHVGSKLVGCAVSRCYSYWFKKMISLGVIEKEYSTPGTNVVITWGLDGMPQKKIRAVSSKLHNPNGITLMNDQVVHRAPFKEDQRKKPLQ